MPRRDGTGPMGMGSMTGRGAGFCLSVVSHGYANSDRFGGNFGRGCRFRRMSNGINQPGGASFGYEPIVDEKEILSRQAEFLENQLQQVKKRLSNLNEDAE